MSIRLVFMPLALIIAFFLLAPLGVSAQAPAPQITFSGNGITIVNGDSTPQAADGTQFVASEGAAVPHVFLIGNSGTANLSVSDVSVPAGFTVTYAGSLPAAVLPNGVMILMVTCQAEKSGSYDGFVSITSNDPDEDRAGFQITCRVNGVPDIDVSGNTVPITNGDSTPSAVDATDFASVLLNAPTTHTFRVSNRGVVDLNIGSVTVPAGFTALNTLPSTIAQGGQADLHIRCNAASENTFAGNVSISSNDPDESPFVFRIRCVVGDGEPDFNPGPDDLPPVTSTAVGSPIVVVTPPPSTGGSNSPDPATPTTSSNGSQSGGSQVNATTATATSTPPRPTATAASTVAAPAPGIFRPPSTGDAGLEDTHDGISAWVGAAVIGAIVAATSLFGARRVFR